MIRMLQFVGRRRKDLLMAVERLRFRVWAGPLLETIRDSIALDTIDLDARHVVCLSDREMIGAGRISLHSGGADIPDADNFAPWITGDDFPAAFLNRLVVDQDHRGRGIAHRIDRARLDFATDQGVKACFTEAMGSRVGALQALGFEILGRSPDRRYPGEWLILRRTTSDRAAGHQ